MDNLRLTANSFSATHFLPPPFLQARSPKFLTFPRRRPRNLLVFASKDESKLDELDKMELKFGRMIGEDPKITLAKIMGRKNFPELSYLEIEKLLGKKKGGGAAYGDDIEEVPFDMSSEKKSTSSIQGLNLVRPVPKKGTKFETDTNEAVKEESTSSIQGLNLVRPVPKKGTKFETATNKAVKEEANGKSYVRPERRAVEEIKSSVPDVILRKPSLYNDGEDGANGKYSRFGMKPNLSVTMGRETQKERFSDITLLKKPEIVDSVVEEIRDKDQKYTILQKPEVMNVTWDKERERESFEEHTGSTFNNLDGFQETRQNDSGAAEGSTTESSGEEDFASDGSSKSTSATSIGSALNEKPKRLDHTIKATDQKIREDVVSEKPESFENPSELENFLTNSPIKEWEDGDWARAEKLVARRERAEVEIISSSTKGFVASFGSLIGFLPYRNLAARWKFLAFESWLRRKGLDPSNYRQNLGIIGKYESINSTDTFETIIDPDFGSKTDKDITPDTKLEDLLMIYDQEKLKFLSSFVGQKIRVGVVLADRNSRKLILSIKPKEKEELVEKKRSVMAQLTVGDVIKCCIKKITYFGVFVEVEGVPALIHQTEVSWDATLDPASYFKVGQIVDAKVHQLDFSLERIFLSLKEITPDPLMEALEAVVGDNVSLDGRLEAVQEDTEWPDVESLINELKQFDGIQSVSKGRYYISPGLAPTFQVYMASMFENQYKLLARAGNRVQEVIVETSLSNDDLKSAIMTCTNRVE